jgi:hypothetical protein
MISLLFFVLFSASAFEVAPANTGQYYLAVFASDSPVTAVIGGEVVLSEESPSGLFALLYIDYESLFITPAPTDVRLIPVDHSAPARFTTKASRRYGFAVIEPSVEAECKYLSPVSRQLLPFSDGDLLPLAVAYHRVYVLCGDRTVYFSDPDELHFPHLPVFLVEPTFIRLPLESRPVLVGFPRVFPAPPEDTVFDISISVSDGGTIVSAARLRPGEFYTIDPAPLSYSVHYQLRLDRDLTELAYGYFSIGPEDTQSESEFDYSDHTSPQKKSLDPIPYTRVQLEPGQVLPRFPDSPGAFVVAEPIDLPAGLESQDWTVVINGVAFVPNNGSRRHVFVAHFGIDYRVAFISSHASTIPAVLSAPPPGIIRQLHPAVRGCDGAVLYPVWTNVGYSRPRPDAVLTEDGHFYQLETGDIVDGCDEQVDIYAPIPSPPPILVASISLARYWKANLSESELCDQMAQIDVEVGPAYSSPLFIEWQGEILRLSESGQIQIKARLPLLEISSIRVYTDGGMRYLARAEVILNKAAGAKSPIDFSHPHPIVLVPYRSASSPGRLVIAANVTDYRGAAVDMNALHPGVYLSTAAHAFPEEHVTCITRELVVVPLASMPYASIDARVSSTTAVCPSDMRGALTPFQIGVPPSANFVLWSEDTGTARPLDTSDARVVTATGTYQLLNTATGEYSAPIVFSPAPYTAAADFVFLLVPRKNKRNPADPFEPDHDLQFKYPRGVRASIWLVSCEPFGGDAFVCPTEQEMFLHLEDGLLLLLGLPFVAKITLEIEIGGACRFEKTGHLLPLSDALPLEISRIECATDCRGMVSAIPFYVDPYSNNRGSLTRAPTLPGVVYESRLDGRLVNRAPSIWAPEPAAREYTVEFTMTRGHRSIVKSQVCQADPAPVFRPRIDLPVFCPDTADARVVFDDLNFKGTVSLSDCDSGSVIETKTTSEVVSRGFAGLEAGPKCFNYTAESWSGRRCEGAHRVDIAQKMHYHVNARAVARPARTGAEVEIRPGGEFDLLTGDMLRRVSDRVYVDDNDGSGTTRVTGLPNGGGVEILIPYPETYSHITRDFCPDPLVLGVDRLADDIVREKKRQDYEVVQEQCVVEPPVQRVRVEDPVLISWQTTFGQIPPNFQDIMQSIIVNRTESSILMAYEHQSGCTLMVEWTTTTGTERKRRSEDRIASKKYQGTLSQIECKVTRPLSCPLCFDAEITLSTNALSPVFYVWTAGAARITDSPVLRGLPAGSYMATAIERGGTVDDSASCVAHIAFEGPVARIEKIETTTARGCPGGAYFDATIKTSRPVPLYAAIDKEIDDVFPVESCADPRFTAESEFRLAVGGVFRAYICDGAEVRSHAWLFNYTGPDPGPLDVAFAEGQFQCQSWVGTLSTDPNISETGFETLTTVVVQDDRECPAFVDVPPGVPMLSADRAMVIQAMTSSELEPDCVINATQTVAEAVDEIVWCASQERQITGNGAPVIDVPVVLPSRATLDMQFLQFSAGLAFGGDTIAFLLDVDFLAGTTNVSAAIATFSYGDWAASAALEIGDTAGIQAQQQQINVQYAPVRDRLTINIASGQKELALVLAYFDAPVVAVTANRTTMLQLLTVNSNEVELRLPRESSKIVWLSTNGGSRIDVLTIFLPGGNVSGANGTWTSSNATIRVACEYLLEYPEIVRSARGGYGGPVFVDREMCIDFGGAASNSQSQSRSQPVYEQVGFPEEITFMFVGIMIVVVIAGVSIAFAFFGL